MKTPAIVTRFATLLLMLSSVLNPAVGVASPHRQSGNATSDATAILQDPPSQDDVLHLPFLRQPSSVQQPQDDPPVILSTVFLSAPTTSEVVSPYGPQRNDPAQGIPAHAYSPFDDPPPASPCPPGGCEAMAGQVVIKFTPEAAAARRAQVEASAVDAVLAGLGIVRLEPVFPHAEPQAIGALMASTDGDPLPVPDLTAWYQAELSVETTDIPATITALQSLEQVEYAEPDYVRRPVGAMSSPAADAYLSATSASAEVATQTDTYNDPLYAQQWHLAAAHVPEAWEWMTLNGYPAGGSPDIVVAVIDTGVDYTHPDLAANMWVNSQEIAGNGIDDDGNGFIDDIHGVNVVSNQHTGNPQDDHGHGTHVAGIIAAQANNGIGGVGVAYNAKIMAIKAAQYSGVLATTDIAEAIYYAVAQGADVINMSFGGYARSQVEEDALAVAFGTSVLVAAAGNDSVPNCLRPMYPAAYNWVLGVMASTASNSLAGFSNTDCVPHDSVEYELMSPGVDIWSTLPVSQYAAWDGTSMATPIVAGMAVLARTRWSDKDVYSSRFIMGQIASNANPVADALSALTVAPKPQLSYLEHWLFDTTTQSSVNDNDGIVDAGETVELAILIRNHWGKADNVTAKLEAWADGAFQPDPYVTFITDTVNYGAIGSFNRDDNGLIYDNDGVITGVRHPFRFSIDPATPNDHMIPMRLTITAENGYNPADPAAPYTSTSRFFFLVQRGRELRGLISEDMTLTKDYFWLIAGEVGISGGVTVTIAPGTQVQWAGYVPKDPYSDPQRARVLSGGTLLVEGTFDEPVELFPSQFSPTYGRNVYITTYGSKLQMRYVKIDSPEITSENSKITVLDHSYIFSDLCRYSAFLAVSTSNSIIEYSDCMQGTIQGNIDTSLIFAKSESGEVQFGTMPYAFGTGLIMNSTFLQNSATNNSWWSNWPCSGGNCFTTESEARDETKHRNNAFLSKYWDPNPYTWMTMNCFNGGAYIGMAHNYWGTTSTPLIEIAIRDSCRSWGELFAVYQPILTVPATTTYPFVVDVTLSIASSVNRSALNGPTPVVSAEPVSFTVSFNRDMDTTRQPQVSFGPDVPLTDYTVHPIDGGWQDARTWEGTFKITPVTGDGYQLIRVAGAVAADDPWLVTGDDAGRFRFEIITSGTEAMNLQATGGEGHVDLSWSQDDFDLLSGFNIYRATNTNGTYTRINVGLIPPQIRSWQDTVITPGIPYFYKFTIVKSDMTESDFSNVAQGTPVDTVPPSISHTPVTTAAPGLALSLHADVTDNVTVQSVTLFYRARGGSSYTSSLMIKTTGNRYNATVPAAALVSPGIDYYVEASDGVSFARSGLPGNPYAVAVVDRPTVTTISPQQGTAAGGTNLTISGSNFKAGASVAIGGAVCQSVVVVSTSQITCVTAAHFPATVDVVVTNSDLQSGTLLQGYTYFSDIASLSLPATGGGQNMVVQVPVNLANVSGLVAASLTISFDNSIVHATGAATGGLTSGWSLASNTTTPGQVRLSMASPGSAVAGSGVLAYISFEIVGAPSTNTALEVTSVLLNDGAITVESNDGSMSVDQVYSVAGNVVFWDDSAAIPGVDFTLSGDRDYSGQSDALGDYAVAGAAAGDYTLTPSKADDVNGISALDASMVLRHDVGLETLSGYAFTAGDVNRNGSVTAFDAFYILQKSVDLITLPFPGAGLVWRFDPATRTYPTLNSDLTNQDFTGILLGDVTGNWSAPVVVATAPSATTASLELISDGRDSEDVESVTVHVDPLGEPLYSLELTLAYNKATHIALDPVLGEALDGWLLSHNLGKPGEIRLALAGATPLAATSTVVTLRFQAIGDSPPVTPVILAAMIDEQSLPIAPRVERKIYLPAALR